MTIYFVPHQTNLKPVTHVKQSPNNFRMSSMSFTTLTSIADVTGDSVCAAGALFLSDCNYKKCDMVT